MESYQSRDWLYFHYWMALMSQAKISKLCIVSQTTIGRWMIKFNISRRSHKEAIHLVRGNHCHLSQEAREWIDGELLGDAGLRSFSPFSAFFGYSSKYKEYINHISQTLDSYGIEQAGNINGYFGKTTGKYSYRYNSRSYIELFPIYKRWYPEGKKIVPRDLKLTPLVCRQWYIGDSHLEHPPNGRALIKFCTDNFSISEVKWLVKQLNKKKFKATRQLNSNRIRISPHSVEDFLNYIGNCPINCYRYKWNYLR